jgi:hypothetical protein
LKIALGTLLLLATAGCSMSHGPSKDSVLVVPDEVVADVSGDQTLLASYASAQLAGPGPLGGTLRVRPLPAGDPILEVPNAFGATFGAKGTTLVYFTGATTGTDAGQQLVDFGQPCVWNQTLANAPPEGDGGACPVPLAAGFATLWTAAPDHSLILFVETKMPVAGIGGTLRLLRIADCDGGSCPTTPIAESPPAPDGGPSLTTFVRIAIAPDGLHAAYQEETKNADGSRVESITLLSIADGSKTAVFTTSVPAAIVYVGDLFSFSPDGSLLAIALETGNGPLQSAVVSTADGTVVPWDPLPADLFCTQVGFSDSGTVFIDAVVNPAFGQTNGPEPQIWRTTPSSSTLFFPKASGFTVSHTYPGTERYLTYTTADPGVLASGGAHDLLLVDLAPYPMALPLFPLASLGNGTLTFSQDVSSAFTFEGFDTFGQLGTLVQVALPSGQRTTIDRNVFTGGASFARGSSKILYFPTPDSRTSSGQPLVEWDGTRTQLEGFALNYVSVDNPPTLFWTLADPRALYRRSLP